MTSRLARIARSTGVAACVAALAFGLGACTQDPARLPSTVGGGVNVEIPEADAAAPVKARNLMVITRDGTTGFLQGALTTAGEDDELVGVSGQLIDPSNVPTGPVLQFDGGPTPVETNVLTQISVGEPYLVTGDIPAGLVMRMTLVFATAGEVTLEVPIIDGNNVDYREASPLPATSATPAAE